VAGPSWLASTLAAVMIATAVYCFSRLAAARRWRRATEYDVDGVHILMGVAMAGMLVPRLSLLEDSAWDVIFGAAAAWFGWQAFRAYRRRAAAGRGRVAHHLQHAVACGAMLYMFLAVSAVRAGSSGQGMPMAAQAGSAATFRTLAVLLALALLGYVIWTADRLTSLAPVAALRAARAETAAGAGQPAGGTLAAARPPAEANASAAAGAPPHASPPMSPRLAACCEIAMGLTMGYMLITML
jgi:hypothetical protein